MTGLATGIAALDRATCGLQRTDLIVLAGRPGMGKSALAMNVATHIAARLKENAAVFSLEMSRDQLIRRIMASEASVDSTHIRNGRLSDIEWEALAKAASPLSEALLFIDDTGGLRLAECASRCRRMALERGKLGLVVVDYLQLMQAGLGGHGRNREQEISEITRTMKALAKELNCPVLALSQLNRDLEKRPDKRPMLSDLRESGAIEQDADVVMFVYRDEYYNPGQREGEAEIIIAKNRSGPLCTVPAHWNGKVTRFSETERIFS
jgi:replicative DNA helicase